MSKTQMNCPRSYSTDKAKDFIEKWCWSGKQQGKGDQENCSDLWFAVSSFMVGGVR